MKVIKTGITGIMTMSLLLSCSLLSCNDSNKSKKADAEAQEFQYSVEKFADLEVLRYQVFDFESLSLKQKELVYYLSQAALEGRDILYDQNCRYNLAVRRTLEAIYANYAGDKTTGDYQQFEVYLKRVWFSNGIHHHYGREKFLPGFSKEFFIQAVSSLEANQIPAREGQSVEAFINEIIPVMFDPALLAKSVVQNPDVDVIQASANNYYGEGITQIEVENFYNNMKKSEDLTPVSYGLNSRLVKKDGKLVEETWKVDGLYGKAIEKIVYWLQLAQEVAENEQQKNVIAKLIEYYQTGCLKTFDEYAILWVHDLDSRVDFVNGFTESYGDPLGLKASWESVVNFKNLEATKRTEIICNNAQWFEDHSPVDPRFKKNKVTGVSAKVITATMLGGDNYPATPIGINLPNADWIRKQHGSKSVTIENITYSYDQAAQGSGFNEEFVWSEVERKLFHDYGFMTSNLNTDLHECLGHGSGQLLPGTDPDALGIYGSVIEETRADLFALYYIADPQLVELGLLPNQDAYKAEYYRSMMNGLITQLVRIEPGKNIEQTHMRNRALISRWVLSHSAADKAVEFVNKDNKTFVVINDYGKLRELFGQLLGEIQRVKSEGDFNGAKQLVETYAVNIDPVLHQEILERYKKLNLAPYKGFVNPVYTLVKDGQGNIVDVTVSYSEGYAEQMIRYSNDFSSLPTYN